MVDVLFSIERKWRDLSPKEYLANRRNYLNPLMMNFYEWIGFFEPVVKSKLAIMVHYVQNLRGGFKTIFEDGRLEIKQ